MRLASPIRAAWWLLPVLPLALTGCGSHYLLLRPAGPVAESELHLIERAAIPMGAVFLLVVVLFAIVLIRFRNHPGNRAPYDPDWGGSRKLELMWFLIPILILAFIAVPMIGTTYALARVPTKDPLVIDVVSIDWKWLFEYPAQNVATVNYFEMPVGQPVLFELTAYSPMNTFWVPQLGGMEYTMPGRVLPLWLESSKAGTYQGRSANYSGAGYAKMVFDAQAVSPADFSAWVLQVQRSDGPLTAAGYQALLKPGLTGTATYVGFPADSFPQVKTGFTLEGGMYKVGPSGTTS